MKEPSLQDIYPDVMPDPYEAHVFIVRSQVDGRKKYRACLDAFNWNGRCNCPDFEIRKKPELEAGAWPADALKCKHIKRARAYHLDEIGRKLTQIQQPRHDPLKGQTGICRLCKTLIVFNGQTWKHRAGERKHPALP